MDEDEPPNAADNRHVPKRCRQYYEPRSALEKLSCSVGCAGGLWYVVRFGANGCITPTYDAGPVVYHIAGCAGGNATWKAFAKDFSDWSTSSPLSSQTVLDKIGQNYLTNSYENSVQTQTPGLGNALYFTRTVTSDTKLVNIMADPKLLKVAVTVAGFDPTQFGALDYPEQQRLLSAKLDLKQFSTPQNTQKFAQRYLATLQIRPEKTSTPASMLTLYGAGGGSNTILSLFGADSGSTSSTSLYSALL
ncbi:DUF1217 domain-containing protein [Neokomagataea tanensis]|uniref:DUF1217 domain-containing protein n=1 Tax=Neokomagataea tanensis TaxID=661191 RepID=UPI001F0E6802|nr:DUF1217 domain-containing protein [Neokomagataea tanensis]